MANIKPPSGDPEGDKIQEADAKAAAEEAQRLAKEQTERAQAEALKARVRELEAEVTRLKHEAWYNFVYEKLEPQIISAARANGLDVSGIKGLHHNTRAGTIVMEAVKFLVRQWVTRLIYEKIHEKDREELRKARMSEFERELERGLKEHSYHGDFPKDWGSKFSDLA